MRAGLAASAATPGSTPPLVSRTSPAIAPVCAHAVTGKNPTQAMTTRLRFSNNIAGPPGARLGSQTRVNKAQTHFSGRNVAHFATMDAVQLGGVGPGVSELESSASSFVGSPTRLEYLD